MGRNVAMVTLVMGLKAQEVRRWAGSGGRPLSEPVDVGLIVGTGPDGAFANICTLGDNFVVRDVATEFKVTVVDGPPGVVKGDDIFLNRCGERMPPEKRLRSAIRGRNKENASHSGCGGVAGADYCGDASGDEFRDSSGPGGHILGKQSKIVQQEMYVRAETNPRAVRLLVTKRFL